MEGDELGRPLRSQPGQQAADGAALREDGPVMQGHQGCDLLPGVRVKAQPAEDLPGQSGALLPVAIEVAHALLIQGEAGGLAQVVEQGGPAQHRRGRGGIHRRQGVVPHISVVPGIALVKAEGGHQLGQDLGGHRGIRLQHPAGRRAAQQPGQLLPHPLTGDAVQQGTAAQQRRPGVLLHTKIQHGGKAHTPQHPQAVLLKAPGRVAHTADKSRCQILPAPVEVDEPLPGVIGHGVDGKVPPLQIPLQAGGKGHPVGVPPVGIGAVHPEGGDLQGQAVHQHRHRAVLQPRLHQTESGKHPLGLLRPGAGGQVKVGEGSPAPQQLPHCAPYQIGPVAGGVEHFHGPQHLGRQIVHVPSPLSVFFSV